MEAREEKLTRSQQNALHLWFEQLAREMLDNGLDLREAMPKVIDIIPTKENIKEVVWKPVMTAMYSKKSTTELLKTEEIDKILMVISKALGERGIVVPPFPNWQDIEFDQKH